MAVLTVIPATDVKLNDVRDTLNVNGGSVNNDLSTFFTDGTQSRQRYSGNPPVLVTYYPNANINKWSKWKPIPCNAIELTQALIANNNAGFYNLTIAGGGLCTLKQIYERAVQVWDESYTQFEWLYRVPDGGMSEPFRLGDFRNYDPGSATMHKMFNYTTDRPMSLKQYFPQSAFLHTFNMVEPGRTLTRADFKINGSTLVNWYLGVMLIRDISYNSGTSEWDGFIDFIAAGSKGESQQVDLVDCLTTEKGAIAFFLSPRQITPQIVNDEEELFLQFNQQDYLLIHHPCYPFTLFNGQDSVINLWEYTSLPFISNLWYQSVVSGAINNLTWASGHGYFTLRHGAWLEEEVGVNQFAVKITIETINFGDTSEGNIFAFAVEYNPLTLEVTEWDYVHFHRSAGVSYLTLNRNMVDDTPIPCPDLPASTIEITNFRQNQSETIFDGVYVNGVKISAAARPGLPVPLFMFGNLPEKYDGTITRALWGVTYDSILVEGVAVEPIP